MKGDDRPEKGARPSRRESRRAGSHGGGGARRRPPGPQGTSSERPARVPHRAVGGAPGSAASYYLRMERLKRLLAEVGDRPGRKLIPLTPDEERALDALRRLMVLGVWPDWGSKSRR